MLTFDVAIIGGGAAGCAAAVAAVNEGASRVCILERESELGGILNQCIHNGFGLHAFGEELTGPEYAQRYITQVESLPIEVFLETTVTSLVPQDEGGAHVFALNAQEGAFEIQATSVVLAMGCRERPRGALDIAGTRPAGVYSAGCAQKMANIMGLLPGKRVVILGSGDIGLIMARRMTLEGATVVCVAEVMPFSSGLKRNIVQCLEDYNIPLLLSHTVVKIEGESRVSAVWIAEVDEHLKPIAGTEKRYDCDCLLLSVGLIPENEISRGANIQLSPITRGALVDENLQTSALGIFSCGNVLHVHDLVDYVSEEAAAAGKAAAEFVRNASNASGNVNGLNSAIPVSCTGGVRYCVPSMIHPMPTCDLTLRFRVDTVYHNALVCVDINGKRAKALKRPVLVPAEMQTIKLSLADIQSICDNKPITSFVVSLKTDKE